MKRPAFALIGFLLLATTLQAQQPTPEQKKVSIAFVAKLQNANGGFSAAPGVEASSLRATSTALRIFKYFGGEVPQKEACGKFVESCFDKSSGGFADTPGGSPDVACTAVGIMAVIELKRPRVPFEAAVLTFLADHAKVFDDIRIAAAVLEEVGKSSPRSKEWVETVRKMANVDGTFGKNDGQARDTGGAVAALLRFGEKINNKDTVLKTLNAGQRPDGGFGKADAKTSDLESSYRVTRCYHMLQAKPDAAKLGAFISRCRNDDGGYSVVPGEKSSISGTYFAAIISHWLAE